MRVVITGAHGFIGKNLRIGLGESQGLDIAVVNHLEDDKKISDHLRNATIICHLAGINRPLDESEFHRGNTGFTERIVNIAKACNHPPDIIFSSSIKASDSTVYGLSKLAAERILLDYATATNAKVTILRLPNVYGKWCKPNYNSVVATFCHSIANGKDIQVHDKNRTIRLVYIDDVIKHFKELINGDRTAGGFQDCAPITNVTLGELADHIRNVKKSRDSLISEKVGVGFLRSLYATYLSYLPDNQVTYQLPVHKDERGTFMEMLKTKDSGQFSILTAKPGVSRGDHYHHTKTEKFFVISGDAKFSFRHILTDKYHDVLITGGKGHVVETLPGWAHNIENVGTVDLIVAVWASENFDHENPSKDVFAMEVAL